MTPSYRRLWPQQLVSWVRLLDGRVRDPLVGRDVLLGVLWGVTFVMGIASAHWATAMRGRSEIPPQARFGPDEPLGVAPAQGIGELLSSVSEVVTAGMVDTLVALVSLVVLRLILRHTIAAVVVTVGVGVLVVNLPQTPLGMSINLAMSLLSFVLLFRFGVLFFAIWAVVFGLLLRFPLTHVVNSWYIGNTIFVVLLVGGIALYGFYTSLAGRSVLTDEEEAASATVA